MVSLQCPHTPFTFRCKCIVKGNLTAYTNGMDATPYFMASIEAMDYQIGRFFASIPADEKRKYNYYFIGEMVVQQIL